MKGKKPVICVFGDDIIWGADDYVSGGWVDRLKQELMDKIEVYNLGILGETSTGLRNRIAKEMGARNPDMILIAMGMNDSRLTDWKTTTPLTDFEKNIRSIISQSRLVTKYIVFLGPTKVDETKTDLGKKGKEGYRNDCIMLFAGKLREICEKRGDVQYIDMFDVLDAANLEDGVHPTWRGHRKIFNVMKKRFEYWRDSAMKRLGRWP